MMNADEFAAFAVGIVMGMIIMYLFVCAMKKAYEAGKHDRR